MTKARIKKLTGSFVAAAGESEGKWFGYSRSTVALQLQLGQLAHSADILMSAMQHDILSAEYKRRLHQQLARNEQGGLNVTTS